MSIETATATILVTDLVASTSLRVASGEERADALRRELDAAVGDAIAAHGGHVVKGLGDGVLATFPGASEALAAAVAVQQATDALGRRQRVDIALRIGISAGDVSVEDGDCFGTPVIEASRLCAAAEADQILVADVVRVLARGRGDQQLQRVGAIELKGLPEPIDAWAVGWEPASTGAGLRQASPYVGRTAERAALVELLELARGGHGAMALVCGEPGIGKSRLVQEICSGAHDVEVLWGGCHDGDVTSGAAVAEAITGWARCVGAETVRVAAGLHAPVLATLAPGLRSLLPELGDPEPVPPDVAMARAQDSLCQLLGELTVARTVILVFDDLHWADDTTIRLLRAAARFARSQRLLVIGTYRETDLDRNHPLAQALPVLRREVEPVRLALEGLDSRDVEDLLTKIAGHDVPSAFAEHLAAQCNGNPFFIRETLLHLVEEGRLAQQDGEWVATTAELGIPEGVREVLGRRLGRLSPAANKLLSVAALCEVTFDIGVVSDVAEISDEEALDAVDEAIAAQVIRPATAFDTYAFTHALFRHTLVAELNPSRQVRLHRAIAEAYEKRLRGLTVEQAATIARHFARSAAMPGAERGVPYATRAAASSEASAAFREAYDFYVMARELLEPGDEREVGVQHGIATNALFAQLGADDQLAEVERLIEMNAAASGEDAAADVAAELIAVAGNLADVTTTWRIADFGRAHLRGDRRDETWRVLRACELNASDAFDAGGSGLLRDTPARRELFESSWATPAVLPLGPMSGAPGRSTLQRWLDIDQPPDAEAVLLFLAATRFDRLAEVAATAAEQALAVGRVGDSVLFRALQVRALLVLGRHGDADITLTDALALLARVPEQSNATFQLLACYAFAGWVRGVPLEGGDVGLGDNRLVDPNTKWAGIAVRTAGAFSRAWRDRDASGLDEIADLLPVLEASPSWAPNYPLIIHHSVSAHWWLERTDHLDALQRLLDDKVIADDQRYPEVDARWTAALIASLHGRIEDARAQFDAARSVLAAERAAGLLVMLEHDAAMAESRAGRAADRGRYDAAVAAVRAGAIHPSMAAWHEHLDRLTPPSS